MIDRIGHTLVEGDVVVMPHKQGYVELQIGRVTGFTPKNVRVEMFDHPDKPANYWNKGGPRMIQPQGLIAITGEDALAYVLKHG